MAKNSLVAYKAVIFDMDGTLVDSLASYHTAFNRGTAKFGLPPVGIKPLSQCLTQGMTLEEVIREMHPSLNGEEFVKACREEVYNSFLTLSDEAQVLLPDAVEVLLALKARGIKMGIATGRSSQPSQVRESIAKLGIEHFFDAVVTCEVNARKPAPDALIDCAHQLGVDPAECIAVGDAESDIEAARAAGATPVAVTTGVSDEKKLAVHRPAHIYHRLADILEWFPG